MLGPCKTDFCSRVCEVTLPRRRRFHLARFSTFSCTHCPPHRWCLNWGKDAFATIDATSSSSSQFLTVEPYDHFTFGMRDLSLLSNFCSCERYLHYPLVACLDLSPVRGSRSCPAVGSLRVPFGADLILPSLMVSLAEAQILPTDGTNCRVTIWGPGPTGMGFWPKEPETMNL